MKYLISLIILVLITSCISQDEVQKKIFSVDELREDFNFLMNNFESIHPNIYSYTSKKDIDLMRKDVLEGLNKPMSRQEFALKITPIISALKDGHTNLILPNKQRTEYLNAGGGIFPFIVRIFDNKVYIRSNLSSDNTIKVNSEIISINGIDIKIILKEMRKYFSAELDHFADIRVELSFGRLLWYLYNFENNYLLELKYNEIVFNSNISGINLEKFNEMNAKQNNMNNSKPFSYYQIEGTSIGVIDFKMMTYKNKFKNFLDSTFTAIKKNNIQHLIIDIRQNGGGNSQLAEMLFDYITENQYKMMEQVEIKVSRQTKKYAKKDIKWYLHPFVNPIVLFVPQARPYFYSRNGTSNTIKKTKNEIPKKVKTKFSGNTYLLTSHYTFSSATMLANVFKCYQMGTILGEETGGAPSAYGDITGFQLPNTKLDAYTSHKKFIDVCDDGQVNGVIPDIEIKQTLEDIKLGRDTAVEYIKLLTK